MSSPSIAAAHTAASHKAVGPRAGRWLGVAAAALLAACSDGSPAGGDGARALFSPEGNNLWAYELTPPFASQKVNAANETFDGSPGNPDGWDINGQICTFRSGGKHYLITGEDTHQPNPPTYQGGPDNFGCGVLSDGRVVTTDIGNEVSGPANGQLIVWFPPFDRQDVSYCKIDLQVATGQQIYVGPDDSLYLASPRPAAEADATAAGIFRYTGPFPSSADAAGGCGRTDALGSPLADSYRKERLIGAPDHGVSTPSGVVGAPSGHLYVASVITGVINEYDADGRFVRTVLEPPDGERLGETPFSTGTPLGLALGDDGTLYYADIGIVISGAEVGPGPKTGSVRRITFGSDGEPNPPETMAAGLQFPDCLGLWSMRR